MNKKMTASLLLATLLLAMGYYVISSSKKVDNDFEDVFAFSESDDYWFV